MNTIKTMVFCLLLLSSQAHAATLIWDAQGNTGPLTIERGETPTGPFTTVATVPEGTAQFILTPGAWGHYRVRNTAGSSNTAQYSSDLYSGFLTDRVDALESQVTETVRRIEAIEAQEAFERAPAPSASNFLTRIIDLDHLEITGTNCVSLATTGSGTRRVVECRH